MKGKQIICAVFLACTGAAGWASDLYFGGYGDTNSQWTGYSAEQSTIGLTNWVAYTLGQPGKIAKAPATFFRTGTNTWSTVFDEHVFRTNGTVCGLAKHDLTVRGIQYGRAISIQDGQITITLNKISEDELKRIQKGRPNQAPERAPKLADPLR